MRCYLLLLLAAFALTVVCTEATATALGDAPSTSDSKKMEVKKVLTRLRRIHRVESEERIVPPVAAYYMLLHSRPSTSTQSSQILHAVENNTPLPKWAKAVVALVTVGMITGAIIGAVKLNEMVSKVVIDSKAA